MAPMMCSRSQTAIRASTFQYQPQGLVYRRAGPDGGFDWHGCSLDQVRSRILQVMPTEIGRHYTRMLRGNLSHQEERRVIPAMEWIEREGPRHGVRTPTVWERARATGRGQYLAELGLSDRGLYNAVGNHFDPDALRARVRGLLRILAGSAAPARHEYPSPADLAVMYRGLARDVRGRGIPVQAAPFPEDLGVALTALHAETGEVAEEGGAATRVEGARMEDGAVDACGAVDAQGEGGADGAVDARGLCGTLRAAESGRDWR